MCGHVNRGFRLVMRGIMLHTPAMYIESVPNRDSPPAILLRESYREGGKVKKRTLLNLSDWPSERIAGFKALLKGGTVIPREQEAITIIRSLPHGHVAAALGAARKIGLDRLIGPAGSRCRDPRPGAHRQPGARSELEARDGARALARHRRLQSRRRTRPGAGGRGGTLSRPRLAGGAPARHRDGAGPPPSRRRHAGAL